MKFFNRGISSPSKSGGGIRMPKNHMRQIWTIKKEFYSHDRDMNLYQTAHRWRIQSSPSEYLLIYPFLRNMRPDPKRWKWM